MREVWLRSMTLATTVVSSVGMGTVCLRVLAMPL